MISTGVNSGLQAVPDTRKTSSSSAPTPNAASNQTTTTVAQASVVDDTQIKKAVTKLNDYVQNIQRDLSFSVDQDSGQTVIKVLDTQTKEVIRQIPAEETLKLAASIDNQLSHLLVEDRA